MNYKQALRVQTGLATGVLICICLLDLSVNAIAMTYVLLSIGYFGRMLQESFMEDK